MLKRALISIYLLSGSIYAEELNKVLRIQNKISMLSKKVTNPLEIAKAVSKCEVDEDIVLSIIMVESGVKNSAYNDETKDYGLMQVNHWHVQKKNLDVSKLLDDPEYNIREGCRILKWFFKTYKDEEEAIGRYNTGTGIAVKQYSFYHSYVEKVYKYLDLLRKK